MSVLPSQTMEWDLTHFMDGALLYSHYKQLDILPHLNEHRCKYVQVENFKGTVLHSWRTQGCRATSNSLTRWVQQCIVCRTLVEFIVHILRWVWRGLDRMRGCWRWLRCLQIRVLWVLPSTCVVTWCLGCICSRLLRAARWSLVRFCRRSSAVECRATYWTCTVLKQNIPLKDLWLNTISLKQECLFTNALRYITKH